MKQQPVHDAGRFNRYLSYENEVDAADGCGGFSRTYVAQGSVWANLCPVDASVEILGELGEHRISHRVLLRYRNGIQRGTRFITGSRKFLVLTVKDPDESRRYLECEVVEK